MKVASPISRYTLMAFGLFLILMIPFLIIIFVSPAQGLQITQEDGIIENLSAFFYFASSVIAFYLYATSKNKMKIFSSGLNRNIFFLLLGLLFFFCFGEEISWGQRIFSITAPDFFQKNNLQNETNIHNLVFFESTDINHVKKSILSQLLTAPGILILFWFTYCFIVPLINILSRKGNILLEKLKLPIIPLWIGSLFVINQIFYQALKFANLVDEHYIGEVKETNVAFLFFTACTALFIKYRNKEQVQ